MKRPEILSPAGDLERLKFAVLYGADAVYVGATEFGMRSAPKNFTMEQLAEGVRFAHARGRRVYLTLNTVPTNEEIARMPDFMRRARETGVDAFIVADLGVLAMAKHIAPEMELHVSTQAGIANYAAASAAYDLGAKRVVLARELSLNDIAVIRDNTPPELELEAFVHGAMCMSVSGRCLLSHYLTGRDANRGECTQPCRWKWQLTEEHRPGQAFEVGETEFMYRAVYRLDFTGGRGQPENRRASQNLLLRGQYHKRIPPCGERISGCAGRLHVPRRRAGGIDPYIAPALFHRFLFRPRRCDAKYKARRLHSGMGSCGRCR